MTHIAILGAGKVGTTIARVALGAGHHVTVAGRGAAADIALLVELMAPGAQAADAHTAVQSSELVIASIPIGHYRSLDPDLLADHVVIDAMNHWSPTDGDLPDFADPTISTSEVVARHLPRSQLVKTLNHIGYHELEPDRRPRGAADRRALAVASDSSSAARDAAAFVDSIGYDPVALPGLAFGRLLEPGSAIFAARQSADDILREVQRATHLARTRVSSMHAPAVAAGELRELVVEP